MVGRQWVEGVDGFGRRNVNRRQWIEVGGRERVGGWEVGDMVVVGGWEGEGWRMGGG